LQYDIVETPYFLQTLCQIKIRLTDSKNIQKQTVSQNNTKGDTAQTISNKIDPSKINVSPLNTLPMKNILVCIHQNLTMLNWKKYLI
jgi:hypothetical protein